MKPILILSVIFNVLLLMIVSIKMDLVTPTPFGATGPDARSPEQEMEIKEEPVDKKGMNFVKDYLNRSSNRFPVSPVKRFTFFNPIAIDAQSLLNHAQLNLSLADLTGASNKVLNEFWESWPKLAHQFNCANHKEALEKNISIINFLTTRSAETGRSLLPAIPDKERNPQAQLLFVTSLENCVNIEPNEKLKVKPSENPYLKLRALLGDQSPIGTGTGWVLSNGLIVTNRHVVETGTRLFVVREDKQFTEAKLVVTSSIDDLALIKVEDTDFLPPALEIDARDYDIGTTVFTVGYPWTSSYLNDLPSAQLSTGIISSIPDNGLRFQLSMPIQLGNSGGPLLNDRGAVIGIMESKLQGSQGNDQPEQVSYAVKASRLVALLEYMSKTAHVDSLRWTPDDKNIDKKAPRVRGAVLLVVVI